ncbi:MULTISPECIES: DNA repair protein RadC [unclassified Paenibacillus]|jgi:DNA repair protein RadC|uniref:RadC family protein n=1 Tax=unclassified Paenibacillus TaxID=185978 RepID=UPI00278B0204|nr:MULTISPECIES: DNA repair protein RadC [unclassified Paenibacillus]MDF2648058.1 repair protein RadC [Paenibacillus sp.]MDQ0901463.1 DNA repair protein RadC [Paenibacillus sp. V4I7]MDQ0920035.1 DNA repair protein RadC [Paenibacillus sp. V4I5]
MEVTSLMLREVPQEERPRERMLQYGAGALSHEELLAILLRTGTVSESALRLAGRILSESGGLRSLVDMSKDQLTQIKGIGDAKALQIQAGIELGRRLAKSAFAERVTIRSPKDIADLVSEDLRYLQKEHFVCLFLNTKNHLLAQETLSMGSLNASIVHPREVFRAAIKRSSASIICVHNHPSGDPTPSPEDIQLTHRLMEAGTIIGIEVLDHVIIGDQRFISLKEQGFM